MARIRHRKVSGAEDSVDAALVQPSDWNDDHELEGLEVEDVAGLADALASKSEGGHGHALGGVAGLLEALAALAAAGVPTGAVMPFAMAVPPAGWLVCDGALLNRADYAALFAAVGTIYGAGDGVTTFALPDLRGEFVRGWDSGRGIDPGRVLGSAQAAGIAPHAHAITTGTGNAVGTAAVATGSNSNATKYTATAGGGETRPRNVAMLICIRC